MGTPAPTTAPACPDPGHVHGHGHAHGLFGHGAGATRRRLAVVLALISTYMVAEAVGGVLANSLALLADAGHMLSDAAALGIALFATWMAQRPPTARRTYGYHRVEVLAALLNGAVLLLLSGFVIWEALQRFAHPAPVAGGLMTAVAGGGLLVNLVGLWILSGGRHESLNVRGAWLHVLADTLGSVGAIAAGLLVWGRGWTYADPLASIGIGLLVVGSAWSLLRETVGVLMEGTPEHIDLTAVEQAIRELPGVEGVHDLHVWTITSGFVALSGHVEVAISCHPLQLLGVIRQLLHDRFGIEHVTVQLEPVGFDAHRVC